MSLTVTEACELINDLPRFTKKHSFEEGRLFLEKLGRPDAGLKLIHVAGTNGKGSVCVFMETILRKAGFHTGCFISPHLEDMRERVRIDGQMCDEEAFVRAVWQVAETARSLYWPTFFEFLFFVGMLIFREKSPDIVILETGLGGRLDATNLASEKMMCVIAQIGADHMQYLGNDIDSIAREKAGIIQNGVPVTFWGDGPGASQISRRAEECGSVKIALSRSQISQIHRSNSGIDFCFRYKYDNSVCLHLNTLGMYQTDNAALAIAALMSLPPDISDRISEDDCRAGVEDFIWPGRMEEAGERIYLDGAHNEPAAGALTATVREDGASHRMLVFGCMADKDYRAVLDVLTGEGLFEKALTVEMDYPRAESAVTLKKCFEERGITDVTVVTGGEAWPMIREYAAVEGNYVYIAGSLYMIGEMRSFLR